MIYVLIILISLFGCLGAISALLLGVSQWKKLLIGVAIVCIVIASGATLWKEILSVKPPMETVQGPGGELTQKATITGFKRELQEAADELVREAEDYFNAAERDFAASRFRDAATNYQKSVDVLPTMSGYLNLGISLFYVSDFRQAEDAFISGLQMARKKGNREFEGAFLGNIGLVYFNQGKLEEALKSHQAAFEIHKQIGHPLGQANDLNNIGNVYAKQGKLEEALKSYQAALEIHKQIGHPLGQANDLGNIGIVYAKQGKKRQALERLRQARAIYVRIGARTKDLQIVEQKMKELNATTDKQSPFRPTSP